MWKKNSWDFLQDPLCIRHFQLPQSPVADDVLIMPGRLGRGPHAIPRSVSAAYPLIPVSSSRDSLDEPRGDSGQEMSHPRNNRLDRSTSAHSSAVKRSRLRPQGQTPYLPLPSDVPTSPDNPVSEQAAELIHEFVHPHDHHHSGGDLFGAEEELDEAGGDTPVIAKELEEMQSRVWWRRPSALWYALTSAHTRATRFDSRFRTTIEVYNSNRLIFA